MNIKKAIDTLVEDATEFRPSVSPNHDKENDVSVVFSFVYFNENNRAFNELKNKDNFIYGVTKFNSDIINKYDYILDKYDKRNEDIREEKILYKIEEDLNDILYREYANTEKKLKEKLKQYLYKEFNISKDGKQGYSLLDNYKNMVPKEEFGYYESSVEKNDNNSHDGYLYHEEDNGFDERANFYDLGRIEIHNNRIKFNSETHKVREDYKEIFNKKVKELQSLYLENNDFGNLNPMKDFQEAVAEFIEKMYDLDIIIKKEDNDNKEKKLNRKDIIDYLDNFTSEYFLIRIKDHNGLKKIPGMIINFNVIGHSFDNVYGDYLIELIINPTGTDKDKFCYRTRVDKDFIIDQAHLNWGDNNYIGFSILD